MKDSTKLILGSLFFVLIGAGALLAPQYREWSSARTLAELETLPLKSGVARSGSEITGGRETWSLGSYGITDLGNLRLAFEDLPFSGSSSSGALVLATDSTHVGGGGSTGEGNRTFDHESIPGGTRVHFGGATFEIVGGKLTLADKTVDVTGPPSLVIIGKDRRIREVRPLKPAAP
ncbi:hypothetical protein OKA04_20175 [Luteolibacter flavescens]|uniref:LPS export ABC transporter periplasmic protein LptC n=1 Tax=Luteolibacter flavescens TaxID=1859460 RepID=A0ABT3FU03_9BACT|nr:hypothetical protein [Luteolibacter flavescens]MCW1887066.1 hypothetical protein [Luteolibacter flavescens]